MIELCGTYIVAIVVGDDVLVLEGDRVLLDLDGGGPDGRHDGLERNGVLHLPVTDSIVAAHNGDALALWDAGGLHSELDQDLVACVKVCGDNR